MSTTIRETLEKLISDTTGYKRYVETNGSKYHIDSALASIAQILEKAKPEATNPENVLKDEDLYDRAYYNGINDYESNLKKGLGL